MYKLIRASAGSGKTFQLSGHFLRELFLGHAPETILATTFTRKAAGEILGRVLLRMAAAAQDADECQRLADFLAPAEVTQERAKELLVSVTSRLHRMRVCTLDSFFQQVARSLTLELGLPPGWGIVDDHVDRELRQQATDAVLAQQMPRDAQRLMQMLAKGHSKRSVRDLIDDTVLKYHELFLLTKSEAWHKIPRIDRLSRQQIEHAMRELSAETPLNDTRVIKAVRQDIERFRAGQWEQFIGAGLSKKVFEGETTYYRKPLPEGLIAGYEQLLVHAKAELLETMAQQTKATHDLIQRFDREYSRLRSEHGWLGFGDVTRVLAQADEAANGSRVNFRLDSRLKHLLLDEFQDTSPDQWKVLRRLALKIAAQPDDSSFFCVGDPKQAIYGWRGGVAEILDVVQNTMPTIEATSLDQSRRSSSPVIETVNQVFQHLNQHNNLNEFAAACFRWQQQFPSHSTVHNDLPGYTELRASPPLPDGSAAERRVPYYHWVAEQIRDLHQRCPGAEIGVLTRKNGTVARLVHELNLMGVPASEEGGTAPTDSPAVLAILSLLHLASHPGCRISRFHVSTSPLAELVQLTTWTDDLAAAEAAQTIRTKLMDDGYGRTLQWLSEGVRSSCNQRDILRLQQVVAQGWQFDQAPSLNPADFVRMLEKSRLSRSETAQVRVMTIHQSKGLEFDIVILPELESRLFLTPSAAAGSSSPGEAPDRVCVWRNKAVRSLLPESLQNAFEQTMSRDVSEALCLLYVALTRAVHALHMFIPPMESEKVPASFAGVLLASLTDDRCAPADHVVHQRGDAEWFLHQPHVTLQPHSQPSDSSHAVQRVSLAKMKERQRGLRREAPSRHDALRVQVRTPRSGQSAAADGLDPRVKGTLVHAWFECVAWLDNGPPDESQLRQIAAEQFIDPQAVDLLIPNFFEILQLKNTQRAMSQAGLADVPELQEFAADIASGSAKLVVENERPYVLKNDGAVVLGTIDRLVLVTKKGKPVAADIVDFKTDRLSGDPTAWVDGKVAHYGPQLAEYRAAVSHCFRIPPERISTRLLLLEADRVVSPS